MTTGSEQRTEMKVRYQLLLFVSALVCMAAAIGIHESIFNNFLDDTFQIGAGGRGWLEFPRETPGFLVVVMAGLLAAVPVTRLGVVGGAVLCLGLLGMAFCGSFSLAVMVAMMVLGSIGMHILMPVRDSIAIALSTSENRGRALGLVGAAGTAGMLLGCGFVKLVFSPTHPQYTLGFFVAALCAAVATGIYALMHVPDLHQPRAHVVFKREYSLYYFLELLFGARKQIFITFGPWVLIRIYGQPATTIAELLIIASVIGLVFKPLVGWAIDRLGERNVLVFDGIALAFVCLGYGFAEAITHDAGKARLLVSACFILDNLLFALGTGRSVYVSRLCRKRSDLISTLAMGVSVNHIASMFIPVMAGMVWVHYGYQNTFVCAAALALVIALVSVFVPGKHALRVRDAENV